MASMVFAVCGDVVRVEVRVEVAGLDLVGARHLRRVCPS